MTPLALPAETAPVRPARRLGRVPLAAKFAFGFVGLVALVLIVNGAIDAALSYNQAKRAALEVQAEKARAAAERVGVFLDEIQTELGLTAGVEWGYAKLEQQRYDFIRLLRQAPAITALSFIDGKGRERLAVSRLEPDAVGSDKDFSADPRFVRAVADKVWFGPVEFRRGSEPYMTMALAHVGKAPGVTVADVNLKLVWDVVSAIRVGDKGFAYVVDDHGRLIAHPDLSLVLRDTDYSALPQVAAALKSAGAGMTEAATSREGAAVLTSYAIAPKTHWAVFVEQPLSEALATAYRSLARSLALLGLGLALAAVSGVALARRMVAPIRALQAGAERLGAGDLGQRLDIRTGDEIEALAGGFNRMAERLKESYEDLEGKVEARTRDLNEALAQQTATADVLKVISRSAFDLQAVFDALLSSAVELVGGIGGAIALREGDLLRLRAGADPKGVWPTDFVGRLVPIDRTSAAGRAARSGQIEYIPDAASDPEFHPLASGAWGHSYLGVPLLRDGGIEGALTIISARRHAFTTRHIELMQTFADQAVIAIENTRLFEEVQARTRDLEETLTQQTATAEVLKVISRSPGDLKPVLDAIAETAARLCGSDMTMFFRFDGNAFRILASWNFPPDVQAMLEAKAPAPGHPSALGRAGESLKPVYIPDVTADPDYGLKTEQTRARYRATLAVPMLREGRLVGALSLNRAEPGAFTPKHIELVSTFADQAAIAFENVRLFEEVRARTRELEESLAQQTATADVLKIISRSAFDLQAVFDTLISSAVELADAWGGVICVRDGDTFPFRSVHSNPAKVGGVSGDFRAMLMVRPARADRSTVAGRAILSREVEQIPDIFEDPDYMLQGEAAAKVGFRAMLGVPLLSGDRAEGALVLTSQEPGLFPARAVEILQTFADQAVIAIENARLFEEVQARTRELEQSLTDLRKAQDRLVQSEKLASLGQLTAGIAHEIKNPLNFVNNFATLSRELLEELRETLAKLPEDARADAYELMGMIDSNLEKVASHGKRADSIVKNMLLHSREGSGERTRVNINAMVEEALNLGYHGARAEKPGFNVTLDKDFDPKAGEAEIYLQEVTRVLLNLISNGFYAGAKRAQAAGPDFAPTLKAATRDLGPSVEIRIRDNGTGIPDEVRAKMFNPFFTTKPAGEGTGLGLSLSHDIVVKQHGGTLDVETEANAFTEFVITLPRKGNRT